MLGGSVPAGQPLEIEGASQPGLVTKNGLVLYGTDGKAVSITVLPLKNIFASVSSTPGDLMSTGFIQTQMQILQHGVWVVNLISARSTAAGEEPAI